LAGEEKMTLMLFDKCPICGGDLIEKEVEKLLRGGIHTAILKVRAEVCLLCVVENACTHKKLSEDLKRSGQNWSARRQENLNP
jgi:YgiT-type zinc finger domain-containing protein